MTQTISQTEQGNPLGYEKLPVLLKSYAIPSIIAMLVSSLYNIVDQIFIGQGVGYLGNAATNVSYPLTTICLAIALLIGIGSASCFSLELGAGREEQAARTVGNAVSMMVFMGILYVVAVEWFLTPLLTVFGATQEIMPYAESYTRITAAGMPLLILTNGLSNLARADGSPKYSMICMVVGAVINTILDPIFIFVLQQGVAGAAIATVVGQLVSCLMALYYLKKFRHVKLERRHFIPGFRVYGRIASLGIVLNNSLTYYGARSVYGSEIPLASCGIVMKTNAILLAVIIGIAQGAQPIIGFNYGAKQYERVRGIYRLALTWNLTVSGIGFLLFQLFPRQIISVFGTGEPLYFEFAIRFLRIFLFMVTINGVQLQSSNFFAAIGKPVKGVILSLTRQVFFLVPLLLVLPFLFGIRREMLHMKELQTQMETEQLQAAETGR